VLQENEQLKLRIDNLERENFYLRQENVELRRIAGGRLEGEYGEEEEEEKEPNHYKQF